MHGGTGKPKKLQNRMKEERERESERWKEPGGGGAVLWGLEQRVKIVISDYNLLLAARTRERA